jgi:hypothetical protein
VTKCTSYLRLKVNSTLFSPDITTNFIAAEQFVTFLTLRSPASLDTGVGVPLVESSVAVSSRDSNLTLSFSVLGLS